MKFQLHPRHMLIQAIIDRGLTYSRRVRKMDGWCGHRIVPRPSTFYLFYITNIYIYTYIYINIYINIYIYINKYIYINIYIWYPPKTYLFVVFTGICRKWCTFWAYILVGGWTTPLKNHGVRQLGWWNSQLNGKIKNDPNHQPVYIYI